MRLNSNPIDHSFKYDRYILNTYAPKMNKNMLKSSQGLGNNLVRIFTPLHDPDIKQNSIYFKKDPRQEELIGIGEEADHVRHCYLDRPGKVYEFNSVIIKF